MDVLIFLLENQMKYRFFFFFKCTIICLQCSQGYIDFF